MNTHRSPVDRAPAWTRKMPKTSSITTPSWTMVFTVGVNIPSTVMVAMRASGGSTRSRVSNSSSVKSSRLNAFTT